MRREILLCSGEDQTRVGWNACRAAHHLALVEAAVADHAKALWERILAHRLRFVLCWLRPTLDTLVSPCSRVWSASPA